MSDVPPVVTRWGGVACAYCGMPIDFVVDFRVAVPCLCGARDRTDRRRALRLAGLIE